MKNNYSIVLDSDEFIITIPFPSLEKIDSFTAHFDNPKNITQTLIDLFKINIQKDKIKHLSINKRFMIKEKEINKSMPIILSNDIYDEEKIKYTIIDYIIQEEARECLEMLETIHYSIAGLNTLSGLHLKNSILSHLDKVSYEDLRKAYFILKNNGYYVPKETNILNTQNNIKELNTIDNYLSHILSTLNSADEETTSKIMEELAGYDLEYLNECFKHNKKPIIDGLTKTSKIPDIKEMAKYLEMLNNKPIEEQIKLVEYTKQKKLRKYKKATGNKEWA